MKDSMLAGAGIDYPAGVARCMDDRQLYETILGMFLEDDTYQKAESAMAAGDYKELFSAAHGLKGVAGNAALTDLYEAICPLVEMVRKEPIADQAALEAQFALVRAAYGKTRAGILAAMEP